MSLRSSISVFEIFFPDGKEDLCIRDSGGVDCRLSDGKGFPTRVTAPALRLVDVNGDGKDDLCGRSSASLDCYLSDGKGFAAAVAVAPLSDANGWNDPSNFLTLREGRVSGGRAADLCLRANAAVGCYRWNGKGFDSIAGPAWSDASGWGNAQHFQTLRLGDFDGDGKDDLCARAASGFLCVPSTGRR